MKSKQSRRSFIGKSALVGVLGLSPALTFGKGLEDSLEKTPKSSMPTDLKITDIKCGFIRNGHSLFVKVHTNQGIWGCGEGVDATLGTYHLVKMFAERIKGQSPLNVHKLFEDIRRRGFFEGAQAGMYVSASALAYYPYNKIFTKE